MKLINKLKEVHFEYPYTKDTSINVFASCSELTPYEIKDLQLCFYDESMKDVYIPFDQTLFDELEQYVIDELLEEECNDSIDIANLYKGIR